MERGDIAASGQQQQQQQCCHQQHGGHVGNCTCSCLCGCHATATHHPQYHHHHHHHHNHHLHHSSGTQEGDMMQTSSTCGSLAAIHHAAMQGSAEIIETLLLNGARVDTVDGRGMRALHYASAGGHLAALETLVRWGGAVNGAAHDGTTPLHLAAMNGHVDAVRYLLRFKADPNMTNQDRETALDLAYTFGRYNVVNYFLSLAAPNTISDSRKPVTTATNPNSAAGSFSPQQTVRAFGAGAASSRGGPAPGFEYRPRQTCLDAPIAPSRNHPTHHHHHYDQQALPGCVVMVGSGSDVTQQQGSTYQHYAAPYPMQQQQHHCQQQNVASAQGQQQHVFRSPLHHRSSVPYEQTHEVCAPPVLTDVRRPMMLGHNGLPPNAAVPTLNSLPALNASTELRQNLKEACFAVQARAVQDFTDSSDPGTIAFREGDLITVLRDAPPDGGYWKGFVTAEGVARTGYFPGHAVVLLGQSQVIGSHHQQPRRPMTLVDSPAMKVSVLSEQQAAPTTGQVALRRRQEQRNNAGAATGDSQLTLSPSATLLVGSKEQGTETNGNNDGEWSPGSPVTLPPQMEVKMDCNYLPTSMITIATGTGTGAAGASSPAAVSGNSSNNTATGSVSARAGMDGSNRDSVASLDSGRGSAYASSSDGGRLALTGGLLLCQRGEHGPPLSPTTLLPPPGLHSGSSTSSSGCHSNGGCYPMGGPSLLSLDGGPTMSTASSDSGGSDVEMMVHWLQSVGMASYTDCLVRAGYDLGTLTRATPEDLNASGVTNPRDRQRLKAELSRLSVPDGLPDYIPDSVGQWLKLLRLEDYWETLESQGYVTFEQLAELAWEDLEDIGIEKLGHQKKMSLAIERLSRLLPRNSCCQQLRDRAAHISPPHSLPPVPSHFPSEIGRDPTEAASVAEREDSYQTPASAASLDLIISEAAARLQQQSRHHRPQHWSSTGSQSNTTNSLPRRGRVDADSSLDSPTAAAAGISMGTGELHMRATSTSKLSTPPPAPPPRKSSIASSEDKLDILANNTTMSRAARQSPESSLSGGSRESTLSRSASSASTTSVSLSLLPFANENIGTIRSRFTTSSTAVDGRGHHFFSNSLDLDEDMRDMKDICEMLDQLSENLDREISSSASGSTKESRYYLHDGVL